MAMTSKAILYFDDLWWQVFILGSRSFRTLWITLLLDKLFFISGGNTIVKINMASIIANKNLLVFGWKPRNSSVYFKTKPPVHFKPRESFCNWICHIQNLDINCIIYLVKIKCQIHGDPVKSLLLIWLL